MLEVGPLELKNLVDLIKKKNLRSIIVKQIHKSVDSCLGKYCPSIILSIQARKKWRRIKRIYLSDPVYFEEFLKRGD